MGDSLNRTTEIPQEREKLLPILKKLHHENNGLTRELIQQTADELGLNLNEVYGTATFYSFLIPQKRGRHIIRACKCFPCEMKSAPAIIEAIAETLGIRPGEITHDGRFSFEIVNCIGACDLAPAMLINDDLHGNLTPVKIADILKTYS